jgi:hypothetical protein
MYKQTKQTTQHQFLDQCCNSCLKTVALCGITQRVATIPRNFATTHRCLWAETSARNYHYTLRDIPEERISRQHRGGNLKSYNRRLFSRPYSCSELARYVLNPSSAHTHARAHTHTHTHTQGLCFNPPFKHTQGTIL